MQRNSCRSKLDAPPRVTWEAAEGLTPRQARLLVEQVAGFGYPYPVLVLAGRNPFARADLWDLLTLARSLGLTPILSTLGSPELDRGRLERLRSNGAHTLCLSLEGSTPASHDSWHGLPGSFESTRQICAVGHRLGLRLQLETRVGPANLGELGRILQHVQNHGVRSWTVNFCGGRAVSGGQCEAVLHFLVRAGQRLGVSTSEAHHYHRVVRLRTECWTAGVCPEDGLLVDGERLGLHPLYRKLVEYLPPERPRIARGTPPAPQPPGSPPVYIDAQGEVRPVPWLPLSAGNVKTQELAAVYRGSWLFGPLRDPSRLTGRCAHCDYSQHCAGSWARSLEASGTMHGEDPLCGFEPDRYSARPVVGAKRRKERPSQSGPP